jgi:hypothetical protein
MNRNQRIEDSNEAYLERKKQILVSMPIPYHVMNGLFDHLEFGDLACDHTHRRTIEFLRQHGLDVEPVVAWFEGLGGFCDCEVMSNVCRIYMEQLEQNLRRQ